MRVLKWKNEDRAEWSERVEHEMEVLSIFALDDVKGKHERNWEEERGLNGWGFT